MGVMVQKSSTFFMAHGVYTDMVVFPVLIYSFDTW